MKRVNAKEAARSLISLADMSAEAGGEPILIVKGRPPRRFGVFLTFESAVRQGIVCEHDEEPARCRKCKAAEEDHRGGRWAPGKIWTAEEVKADPDAFWEDLVLSWAKLGARYRKDLICGEPLAEEALNRLLAVGKLVVVESCENREHDLIWTAEAAARQAESLQTLHKTPEEATPTGARDPEPEAAAAAKGTDVGAGDADVDGPGGAAVNPQAGFEPEAAGRCSCPCGCGRLLGPGQDQGDLCWMCREDCP